MTNKTKIEFHEEASVWRVNLTEQGTKVFLQAGGTQFFSTWTFEARVHKKRGRTERELCAQIRRAGIRSIYEKCRKEDIRLDRSKFSELENHEFLTCSLWRNHPTESVFSIEEEK